MNNIKLNKEEKNILENYKTNKLKKTKNHNKDLKNAKESAKATLIKSKHISIRLSEKDIIKLKQKALKTGIPYQTLIGSLIHQYVENRIKIAI